MSESKENKWLREFTLDKEVEIEKTEEQEVNGEKVKVTRKVKEKRPIKFALKRPTRRLYENGDLFYGVQLSEGIRAGLLTKALLLKRYRNDGGALSEPDAKYFAELASKLTILENEHQRLLINLEKLEESARLVKLNDIVKQKMEVLQALQTLETVNQALFAHTAESKAQFKLNNWWIVHLAYWDEKSDNNLVPFFPGETFEEKIAKWDDLDETNDPFTLEALARFSLLVGLWNAGAQTREDFEAGEREYGSLTEKPVETPAQEEKIEIIPVGKTATNEITPTPKKRKQAAVNSSTTNETSSPPVE